MGDAGEDRADEGMGAPRAARGRLFRKYAVAFVAVVSLALVSSGLVDIWFSNQEQRALLVRIQHGEAEAAAASISQYVREIENQMAWTTLLPWSAATREQWRFDAVRLLRQVQAVTEITQLDADGRELFRMSRYAKDVVASHVDHSKEPAFIAAMENKVYYGPVYFLAGSEPYMTLALAGPRPENGVILGQVNLKYIWDVVSRIRVGKRGIAYVVDAKGRLIAHPDISLVLRNIDMTQLPQVRAAWPTPAQLPQDDSLAAIDLEGRPVLSAHAHVTPLRWLVFVDLPADEAYAPLYQSLKRSGALLLIALALALAAGILLARRMTIPIRALHKGAAQIGGGDLTQRISIQTADELEELGDAFNAMARRLEESHNMLEQKVEERTHQLELANQAKSRFLAAASHDLRQPLHALGMFVGQLRARMRADERKRVIGRIEMALAAMNELFNALLDISKLDAGALKPNVTEFPVQRLLSGVEATFADAARRKGLTFHAISSSAWVRSDFILLEQIAFNLVSNAIRYTDRGRVLIGCRRQSDEMRIEVWDTGPGIPDDQRRSVFGEFYRLEASTRDGKTGLGLGLAIVDRLCRLLGHRIELNSTVSKGSCFSISMAAAAPSIAAVSVAPLRSSRADTAGKLVVVIDDDPLVRDGMSGLLRSWGCEVLAADTVGAASAGLAARKHTPDLIVSDYHLPGGKLGIEVIGELRASLAAEVPAFLMSGDTDGAHQRRASASGLHLLHKPIDPMALRAMFVQVLAAHSNHTTL